MKKTMYKETSSEETEEESDGGSDYEVSERSEGNVDEDNVSFEIKAIITRRRAKPVMMSISEGIKIRPRNSIESPILVRSHWQTRRPRTTTHRRPAQRFQNPIVALSSSSTASIVPVAVSSKAQVNNVNGRTITTSLIPRVNANSGNITTSLESRLNPSSSSINQDSFFGSSSSVINLHRSNSASHPIPTNTFPFPLGLSNESVQGHVNITRQVTSFSQPWRGLDLNRSANEDNEDTKVEEEDDDGKKDEGLDLNMPPNEDDKKDEGFDLNQPAKDV